MIRFAFRTSPGPTYIAHLDLPGMATYLNWINIMTYDFHGELHDNHRPLMFHLCSDEQVVGTLKLGIMLPCSKTVMKWLRTSHQTILNLDTMLMQLFKRIFTLVCHPIN